MHKTVGVLRPSISRLNHHYSVLKSYSPTLKMSNTADGHTAPKTQSTVIIGAGIMGCATAYYLSQSPDTKPDTIHLIEASPELFASASGRAAGFVAPDCMCLPIDCSLTLYEGYS